MKLQRFLIVPLIGLCCWAQDSATSQSGFPATWQTGIGGVGFLNGRFWKTLDDSQKRVFVFGYANGSHFAIIKTTTTYPEYKRFHETLWPTILTFDETKVALDRFYEAPENGPVSISDALQVTAARAKGTAEDVVQKFILELRAAASK